MFRKISDTFTATHLTVMFALAMFAPTALHAIPSFTNIAIEDPGTGARALVDTSRRVAVYDQVADFANNPLNYVRIYGSCQYGTNYLNYTVPTGRLLIVKAANFYGFNATAGQVNYISLYSNSMFMAEMTSSDAQHSQSSDFGNGFFAKAGEILALGCASNGVFGVSITGYLLPAAYAPPASAMADQSYASPMVPHAKRS